MPLGAGDGEPEGEDMDDRPAREIDLRDDRAAAPNCRTPAGLRFRAELLDHLRAGGFPVDGRPAGGYDPNNPAHLAEAGRGLARYHGLVRSFRPRFRAAGRPALPSLERSGPYVLAGFSAAAEAFLGAADRGRLTRASSYLWSQFIRVPEALADVVPVLPQLVIHGSYEPDVLVFDGDRLTAVTGFGWAAYDLRALDFAHALGAFGGAEADGEETGAGLDLDRAGTLMAAYRSVEPVPAAELAALALVLRARTLASVLAGSAGFLSGPDAARTHEQARGLVDVIERAAIRTRWLEREEPELVSALSGSLVA
jgi:Ser/Thr protein kinase RdoA (MazF antagonist)